jgi:hypothetical protein
MSDDTELLKEIRDLLKEQNRMNAEALQRQIEHMAKAQEMADRSAMQASQALKHTGWLKWGFWVFLFALLLVFLIPNVAR